MKYIKQNPVTTTAQNVADFFLFKSDPEIGDIMSNLKLQKLVYYAQGFHLAMYDTPFFDDDIEAWEHGPVISELYHKYKTHGASGITRPEKYPDVFSKKQKKLLDEIHEIIGQYSAWKLRNQTHSEPPWKKVKDNIYSSRVISRSDMKKYFKTRIRDN